MVAGAGAGAVGWDMEAARTGQVTATVVEVDRVTGLEAVEQVAVVVGVVAEEEEEAAALAMVLGLEVALGMARVTGWAAAVVAGEEEGAVAEAGTCSLASVLGWVITALGTGPASIRATEAAAEAEASNPGPCGSAFV